MDEISTCHVRDSADGIISNPILGVGTNATGSQFLVQFIIMAWKQLGKENTIASVDCLNHYSNISSLPIK
jgi:hypothetical protein